MAPAGPARDRQKLLTRPKDHSQHRSPAAMADIALVGAVESCSHAISKAIWACRNLQSIVQLLQLAAATLLDGNDGTPEGLKGALEGLEEGLQERWQQLQALAQGRWHLLRPCFFGLPFREFGEVLLSVVAPDWRPSLSPEQDASLFLRFFREAPAEAALQVLVTHLASVELPAQPFRRGRASFAIAVSAEVACELLAERFARPVGPGLHELLATVSDEKSVEWNGGASAQGGGRGEQLALAGGVTSGSGGVTWHQELPGQCRPRVDLEALAVALASIPERAAACNAPLLLPSAFVPFLLGRVLSWLQQLWVEAGALSQHEPGVAAAASSSQAGPREPWGRSLGFAAGLVSKLCRRGHAQDVAAALWDAVGPAAEQQLQQRPLGSIDGGGTANGKSKSSSRDSSVLEVAARLVGSIEDSTALEKLLEALLRVLAAEAERRPVSRGEATPAPEPAGPATEHKPEAAAAETAAAEAVASSSLPTVTDDLAVSVLCTLLPPLTWASRPDLQYALAEKLLTQRLLPPAVLCWLMRYVDDVGRVRASASASSSSSSSAAAAAAVEDRSGGVGSGSRSGQGSRTGIPTSAPGASALPDVACQLARVWGDPSTIQRIQPQQQAYLTAALLEALRRLGSQRFQSHPELLGAVLSGVGARLESPIQTVRRQAMRVGHSMSLLLDPSKPLFEDEQPWELLPGERWWDEGVGEGKRRKEGPSRRPAARQAAAGSGPRQGPASTSSAAGSRLSGSRRGVGAGLREAAEDEGEWPLTETDSDDEAVGEGSGDEDLEPYDLEESDEEDPCKTGLQLRDLTSMLLKGEQDWKGQLKALRSAEALIRAAPDELQHYAVPLARALLHTPLPKWAAEESKAGEEPPEVQRFRALVAATVETPSSAGLALASELYSSSLDTHHRDLVLNTLSAAAQEMAHPGTLLQPLPGMSDQRHGPGGLLRAGGTGDAARLGARGAAGSGVQAGRAEGRAGRVTRVSERALASMAARGHVKEHVNRFPSVALSWAAALLRECDRQHHGIDLFGRDFFLLGRLLITLGTFMECCTNAPQAMPLAAAVVELVRSKRVHAHPEPYVRRASLLAVSQVMTSLPPARVSSAMLGAAAGITASDSQDATLISRLDWVRQWTETVAEGDSDEGCRKMAGACRRLQASLAAGALAALDSGEGIEGGGLPGGGRGSGSAGGLLPMPPRGVRVSVPQLEELRLR